MTRDFNVSLFQPEDAPDVCALYREVYGEDFPLKYVYDPEAIVAQYDGIKHRTAMARLEGGELAGMVSMFRSAPNPLLYEVGQLMVRKTYRKRGIAEELSKATFNEFPTQVPVKGQFGEALCNHTISQKMAEGYGLVPTALELEWLPTINFDNAETLERNITLLMMFKTLEDEPREIFVHPAYAEFVKSTCSALAIDRRVQTAITPGEGSTQSSTNIIGDAGIATLTVSRVGADLGEVLARFEAEAASYRRQVKVDVSQPGAPWAVDIIRENGFFLGGYLPLWFESDGIMMQKLPIPPDFSLPQFHSENGAAVMRAVKADFERMERG
ncbi:GNAT family N-acetyltransferase [Pseudodesulfovibrio sp. zrk46]|uniref:GNAT family N-acetyltransferase n=1 Tax=Pseudodesulfovibrio sp. zrk46 TaxID=2725288 RepID=UPI001448F933|nr:GNAT family N-acetyltransferase [Pseudodesulfovibrio sp. zrk46]QJB57035.1 GNAT family N-acetyltransferase [Pseudodesulfovibrio sp. zrk46]